MFMPFAPLFAAAALQAAPVADLPAETPPAPLVASGTQAEAGRLHIGNTGINCLRLPCPSRAVFVPDERGQADRNNLLYADLDGSKPAPPMLGDAAHLAAIETAWEERQCLAIDGRLIPGEDDRPVLRVDRIVGPCAG